MDIKLINHRYDKSGSYDSIFLKFNIPSVTIDRIYFLSKKEKEYDCSFELVNEEINIVWSKETLSELPNIRFDLFIEVTGEKYKVTGASEFFKEPEDRVIYRANVEPNLDFLCYFTKNGVVRAAKLKTIEIDRTIFIDDKISIDYLAWGENLMSLRPDFAFDHIERVLIYLKRDQKSWSVPFEYKNEILSIEMKELNRFFLTEMKNSFFPVLIEFIKDNRLHRATVQLEKDKYNELFAGKSKASKFYLVDKENDAGYRFFLNKMRELTIRFDSEVIVAESSRINYLAHLRKFKRKDTNIFLDLSLKIVRSDYTLGDNLEVFFQYTKREQPIRIETEIIKIQHKKNDKVAKIRAKIPFACIEEKAIPYRFFLYIKNKDDGQIYKVNRVSKDLKRHQFSFYRPDNSVSADYVFEPQKNLNSIFFVYREKEEIDSKVVRRREAFALLTNPLVKLFYYPRKILVFEKFASQKQDNGWAYFEYATSRNKNYKYVLSEEFLDKSVELKNQKSILVKFSLSYFYHCLNTRLFVASDSLKSVYSIHKYEGSYFNRINKKTFFFLQHGVIGFVKLGKFFDYSAHNFDYIISSTHLEKEIIQSELHYPEERVPLLGQARWDNLRKNIEINNSVLYFPSWRKWMDGYPKDVYMETTAYSEMQAFINSEKLNELLEKNDFYLDVYLHPKMQQYNEIFSSSCSRIRMLDPEVTHIPDLVKHSAALITDYSSISWDFAFQRKPVYFYQFDQEDYFSHEKYYMDPEVDWIGPVYKDVERMISRLADDASEKFKLAVADRQKLDNLFTSEDSTRKATYEFIHKEVLNK